MYPIRFSTFIWVYFFLHQCIFLVSSNSSNDIAVNCGSSGNSTAEDGRKWVGDTGSKQVALHVSKGKLSSSKAAPDRPLSPAAGPYMTARISRWPFAYAFRVSSGQKFIRLHFYPASYRGLKRSKALFTVKAGPYTLLSNFSASLTADALGAQSLVKEFCVNVEENQPLLIITFSPSSGGSDDDDAYAFVNGIEIISMPAGLYHTREGDQGAHVVGQKYRFPIDTSIAMETVQRLNVGGSSISSTEDTGMFRDWSEDSNCLMEKSSVKPVATTIRIKYISIPPYTAPQKVYQTSWSMVPDKQANNTLNLTWKLSVDMGFRYLLRLHFCELEYEIKESGRTEFSIFVNEQVAEAKADIIKWSGGNGIAVYRDYVVRMEGDRLEGKQDLLLALQPHKSHNHDWTDQADAILKGLEVFKLSNPDKNLAGVNPVLQARASTSSVPNPQKLALAHGLNAIATRVVILLTVLNIIVYKLRLLGEILGENNISSSPYEGFCRHFSLDEVLSVTNNFHDELVIGRGGFGKVYKALIDDGTTTVAIKRLNSQSKQGAIEFWTEIEMLSNLRHTHLVSLIGYCDERREMILVYEYMEHGTLADHLYKINTSGNGNVCHMSWVQRLDICIGAARGLDYLHTGTRHGIIHRDVKTTNILLDRDWVAKISDFGLCKVGTTSHSCTHVSTDVKGTFGYLDPEYFLTRRLTKKSDVYAFGVVMLEMLCGRPAVDARVEEEQRSLVIWAQQCIKEKELDQLLDPSLRGQISPQCLKAFAEVANKCLNSRPSGRPTMADVVVSLESVLASEDQCRVLSTELGEKRSDEDDDDVNSVGSVDEQIDETTQMDGALVQSTVSSPTTLVQYNQNMQSQKRSKGKLSKVFLRSFELLAKGMDIWGKKRKDYDSNSKDYDSNSQRLQWDNATLPYRCFSVAEIRIATNNFDEDLVIEQGGFGKVYKGWIDNGTLEVAVKTELAQSCMRTEIQIQSQLRHLNILSLIGYCNNRGLMLVHNYMGHGSLSNHLYPMATGYCGPLPWIKRLEICIGAARGLQYLHSGTAHTIIHRDIKPSNIFLDENWVAKVSNFELAKELPIEYTIVCDSWGYIDNEYIMRGRLTQKSDVYSFGVVLLEVLCARKPIDASRDDEDEVSLVHWFRTCVQRKKIEQIIDPCIVGRISPDCLREFIKIAWKCVLERGVERPLMDDVVGSLQIALQLQRNWLNGSEVDSASNTDP